jgi:hypothetical protein
MTRGTDANLAFVFTKPARPADPTPATRSAPELARYERIRREHRGLPPAEPAKRGPGIVDSREPIAVLADVLDRDGAELSASETRRRNLANADHLGVLNAIWTAETRDARDDRYRQLVMAALPSGYQRELSHKAKWLFRTLRAAELAGLDPGEVTRTAIASQDLAGARDIASVIDARIRQRVYPLLPQLRPPWASRVPRLPDPERQGYLAEIAATMDDRKQCLGQHAAQTAPAWAVTALGPVPADPAARNDWETKATSIAAYRETYGYHRPDDPIGPEPARVAPEQRAAWYEAFLALGPADGPDVRTMPDGRLWLIRDTYAAETAWAPRHVGKELRLARLGAANSDLGAIRAAAEADAARKVHDHDRARRHETMAASYQAMRDHYRQQEAIFAQAMADRLEWEDITVLTRHLAIAADAELRRRHPSQQIEPLRSAEPAPPSETDREELTLIQGQKISEMAAWIRELATQRHMFRAKLEQRHLLKVPSEDPSWQDLGEAFPAERTPARDEILQPPKPQIIPSAKILQLAAGRDPEPEAAD